MKNKNFTLRIDEDLYLQCKEAEKSSDIKLSEFIRNQFNVYIKVANRQTTMILSELSYCKDCAKKNNIQECKFSTLLSDDEKQITLTTYCKDCSIGKPDIVGWIELDEFDPELDYGLCGFIQDLRDNQTRLVDIERSKATFTA